MQEASNRTYSCTTPKSLCYWAAVFLIVYGALWLLASMVPWLAGYDGALLFTALGVACLVNALYNRTFHCLLTGPLFLVVALLLALDESGVWEIPGTFVWALVLIGAGVALLLEQRYSRDNSA